MIIFLVLTLTIALSGCISTDNSGSISGIVIDGLNHQPLENAKVTVGSTVATTDANGYYSIDGVSAGEHDLTFSFAGYTSLTEAGLSVQEGEESYSSKIMYPDGMTTASYSIDNQPAPGTPEEVGIHAFFFTKEGLEYGHNFVLKVFSQSGPNYSFVNLDWTGEPIYLYGVPEGSTLGIMVSQPINPDYESFKMKSIEVVYGEPHEVAIGFAPWPN